MQRYIPTPLSSSLGKSGRAGGDSLEYHILNAATFLLSDPRRQYNGFYFFNDKNSVVGLSNSNKNGPLPYAVSWIWSQSHRIIVSLAGNLQKKGAIGLSFHYFPDSKYFYPHLGFIYQIARNTRIGFTIDFVNAHFSKKQTEFIKEVTYGLGLRIDPLEYLKIWSDVVYEKNNWSLGGGLEFVPSSYFSIRVGQSYPQTAYTLGMSLKTETLVLHYGWAEKEGHHIGFQF